MPVALHLMRAQGQVQSNFEAGNSQNGDWDGTMQVFVSLNVCEGGLDHLEQQQQSQKQWLDLFSTLAVSRD